MPCQRPRARGIRSGQEARRSPVAAHPYGQWVNLRSGEAGELPPNSPVLAHCWDATQHKVVLVSPSVYMTDDNLRPFRLRS